VALRCKTGRYIVGKSRVARTRRISTLNVSVKAIPSVTYSGFDNGGRLRCNG